VPGRRVWVGFSSPECDLPVTSRRSHCRYPLGMSTDQITADGALPASPTPPLYSSLLSSTSLGMTHRILVVDDEPDITALVAYHLAKVGYRVSTAANGPDALRSAREERPDVVVLDLMLPGVSGYDVLAELRRRDETRDVGVILLTARREETDKIRGLSLGADDYLTKPFSPQELSLRVKALLRRLASPAVSSGSTLSAGPVTIDRSAHRASLHGKELSLTATEYKLLLTLIERRGRVQTRPQLLEIVWEAQPDIQTRTVDMHVQRLRSKLGDSGKLIETVRGFGYRFRGGERGARSR
jgi:two-component system, OmpR family, phosphate regulon response regulator PhoB